MFHPLPLYVGLRYVRARSHRFFVSFITWVSLLGVALGVAALIVILSVMNGLGGELRARLLSLAAQARINAPVEQTAPVAWEEVAARVAAVDGVASASVYTEMQALAIRSTEMLPILLRALPAGESAAARDLEALSGVMTEGSLEPLREGADAVILGRALADRLGATVGDALTVLIPEVRGDDVPGGRLRELAVAGIFEAGVPDHDASLAVGSMASLGGVGAVRGAETGVRVTFDDPLRAPALHEALTAAAGAGVAVRDWTQDHASYFRAIRIEKTMMAVILLLIVAVATFNLVAMLVMVVTDKRTDVAILRTFGIEPRAIAGVFLTQGLVIGWAGVIIGVVGGVALALQVPDLAPLIERLLGFQIMDADVYYISRIPSELRWSDVTLIATTALLLTGLATVYPALRAARIPPAEALRYE